MKSYLKDTSGNMAMMFGLACVTIVVVVGAAVDFTGLSSKAQTLQDYTDSAVLAAATSRDKDITALTAIVNDTMRMHNDQGWAITADVTIDSDDVITVATSTVYDPFFMGIAGYREMPISVSSSSPHGKAAPLNIAFVLDSTFSMRDGNMTDLKTATTGTGGMLDKLESLDNDKIRMSVVPFSQYVNVGLANRGAPWLNVPATDSETRGPEVCGPYQPTTRTCTGTQVNTSERDGITYTYTTNTGCTSSPSGPPTTVCKEPVLEYSRWEGCVGSRTGNKNKRAEVQNGNGNKIPGLMKMSPAPAGHYNPSCGTEILGLTNNYTDVKSRIDGMTPTGSTYIPTGLLWGWRTLTPEAPYDASLGSLVEQNEPTINALVLMSDGANTVRKEDVYHIDDTTATIGLEANDLTAEICQNIKDEGILIFTVAYNFPNDPVNTKAMLESCATATSNYFDANNAAELQAAFGDIADQVFSVYISD